MTFYVISINKELFIENVYIFADKNDIQMSISLNLFVQVFSYPGWMVSEQSHGTHGVNKKYM